MRTILALLTVAYLAPFAFTVDGAELPFGPKVTLDDAYPGASSVATGDIDQDGLDDLVAAAFDGGSLEWWRSAGDGTFTRHDVAASALSINDVELADVDGDGDLDVVASAAGSINAVGWYENDGTPAVGGWPLRLIAIPFNGAFGTAVGDVDGDGTVDVVGVAASANLVAVARNINGTGIGWSYETVDAAFTMACWVSVGDVDQDGDLDVAAAAYLSGEVSWWSRVGSGPTWTEHPITTVAAARVMELVDMDRDGDLDALGAGATSAIRWWENDGSGGTWSEHTVGDPTGVVSAAYPVDLDRDGDPDVLYSVDGSSGVGWYENTEGDALTWQMRTIDATFTGAFDVAAGDFDHDGDLDLAAVDLDAGEVAVWMNLSIHRSATFPMAALVRDSLDRVVDLVPADLDQDGDLDLVVAASVTQMVCWLENTAGDGSAWALNPIRTVFPADAVAAGDLDGDGLTDVVGTSAGTVLWWRADGSGGWTENTIPTSHTSDDGVALADLDRDGDLDVVLSSYFDGIDWQENSGHGGSWTERVVGGGNPWDADSMTVADVDGDGDPDVALGSFSTVEWIPNDVESSGFFGAEIEVANGLVDPRSIAAGDVDGDGDVDLASVDRGTDSVLWWPNSSGDGTSWGSAVTVASAIVDPRIVRLADLDQDGDLDLAMAAEAVSDSASWVGWFENEAGDGSVWVQHTITSDDVRPATLVAADFDGDGDPDLAHDSFADLSVIWWRNRGGQAAAIAEATAPATLDPLTLGAVLEITALHRGRTSDADAEVSTLDLFLTDGYGTPLTDAEADALLYGLYLFEDDDDSGDFDQDLDQHVVAIEAFALTDGVLTVYFSDSMDQVRFAPDLPRTLFVALAFESDAAQQTPGEIEVTYLASATTAEDRDHDLPLLLEWSPDVASGVVVPNVPTDPNLLFADGFESGETTAWSASVP